MGFGDSHIIFLSSLDVADDPRNSFPGLVFTDSSYVDDSTEVVSQLPDPKFDYVGDDVTVENFVRVLTGKHFAHTAAHKRMTSDENSRILIFMSGHGGDEFFKFQGSSEELTAHDLRDCFRDMHRNKRYKEILLIVDTCQASTLATYIDAPNITTIASSAQGENSYSYLMNEELGVAVIDRFSYSIHRFYARHRHLLQSHRDSATPRISLQHLVDSLDNHFLRSTVVVAATTGARALSDVAWANFFAPTQQQEDAKT